MNFTWVPLEATQTLSVPSLLFHTLTILFIQRFFWHDMGSHIDCKNLVITHGDETTSYFCSIMKGYVDLDHVDEETKCIYYESITE